MRCWLCLAALLVTLRAAAQGDTPVSVELDVPVVVSVIPEQPAVLHFANDTPGITVDIVTRLVSGEGFDSVLWVTDDRMRLLAYRDDAVASDGSASPDARIENLTLPESGTFRITVDSFNGVSSGQVEVTIRRSAPAVEIEEAGERLIIRAQLSEDQILAVYSLHTTADRVYTITARDLSGTLDPILRIIDNQGALVAVNDDHGSADRTLNIFDARLTNWQAPVPADYTVEVQDFLSRAGILEIEIVQD